MFYLLNYTRKPVNSELYDARLAYSMHLAISEDGENYQALNHNSGVLFVKATENEDGSLNPKSIRNPYIFPLKGEGYGVVAVRTGADGEDDEESRGSVVLFVTEDFLAYEELGLVPLEEQYVDEVVCDFEGDGYVIRWRNRDGSCSVGQTSDIRLRKLDSVVTMAGEEICENRVMLPEKVEIEGAVAHNVIEIPSVVAERLKKKLLTPVNTGISFPEQVMASSREELDRCFATAAYSDGTTVPKRVDWVVSDVVFKVEGKYRIKGTVHQDHFPFPVAENRADPCIGKWNGKYYFIATNDADGNRTLYVREADTIPGLLTAEEKLILDCETYPEIGGLLWAPEFHEINGTLYIFHAATTGEFFYEESHVMQLKEGGNPANRDDWSRPRRVVRKDGSELCEAGKEITLDMTCFEWQGEYYAVWSQRQFLPKDLGAWLYIAKLNPEEPWRLLSDPVILSKPEYGWANNHTFVDEGPYALKSEDTLYLTFSSAAVDSSYVVGLLQIGKGKDLLIRENWRKTNYPILTSRSVEGEFGTGHNAYVTDEDGMVWNTYHARPGVEGVRSSGIRRVHFDMDGAPMLDLTEELDVAEAYKEIETVLVVEKK
ncbi:MAG: family 43 glycosylhydrolase [Roseburia sp.]